MTSQTLFLFYVISLIFNEISSILGYLSKVIDKSN